MLRSGVSLPLRLLRDAAPAQRHIPSTLSSIATTTRWQQQKPVDITALQQQLRSFSLTSPLETKRRGNKPYHAPRPKAKKRYSSPGAKRKAEAILRKNIARKAVLNEERALAFGDPVWGAPEPTEFVKSFDVGVDAPEAAVDAASGTSASTTPGTESASAAVMQAAESAAQAGRQAPFMNDFVRADELVANLEMSRELAAPREVSRAGGGDPTVIAARRERHEKEHVNAVEAVSRILATGHASSKGRKHINIQRCIDKFGRHNTDAELLAGEQEVKQRIGPDTGSSEVQIALLTLKIRRLAHEREGPLKRDKVNKRNLRILLHRRQKLMKYFWKKNSGGPRWQNMMDTLGLTDANWKGEIMLA